MKIALAQINPTVGDIAANTQKVIHYIQQAQQEAQLVVFSELSITGYPPRDLLLRPSFIDDNIKALDYIAAHCGQCAALVGFVCRHTAASGKTLHNAAALLYKGKLQAVYYKQLLPSYDVFDETRYFEPAHSEQIVEFNNCRLALTICEDIWQKPYNSTLQMYDTNPLEQPAKQGVDVVLNMSASPFELGKNDLRRKIFAHQCRRYRLPLIYVNQTGGNDDLIFDGCSCAFNNQGQLIAQARDFAEDLLIVDTQYLQTDQTASQVTMQRPSQGTSQTEPQVRPETILPTTPRIEQLSTGIASVHNALVMGLGDYVRKCNFHSVVLGLSGGIDSAVTAAIASQALGADNVTGVALPSRYSSQQSLTDAQSLAHNLAINFLTIPIEKVHIAMEQTLKPVFANRAADVTEENIQARIRGNILMALSNKFGHLLLTTGNKSELAVGYCTMYGDMAGGLAVISDVPKQMVYDLARYINREREIIPVSTITKPPSAELRPDQTDEASLGSYAVLDEILHRYIEQEQSPRQIISDGFDATFVDRIIKLIDRSEYKRKQAAPGLKVTSRAFGTGRRMPIAQNYSPFFDDQFKT